MRRKAGVIGLFFLVGAISSPAPSSGTLVLQAISALDTWPATCAPGVNHYRMTAFGAVLQKELSDLGRSWFLEGEGGRCLWSGGISGGSTCTASYIVGATDIGLCESDFERRCVDEVKVGASATAFTFDGGGESDSDTFMCYEEQC